jgi:mono/diheme cytochrome c family protein
VAAKPVKEKKLKMVRDSFTMPKPEYAVLDVLKLRAAKLAMPIKKTELIRAGIKALAALPDAAFLAALRAVPNLKTGRPAKG